MCALIWLVLLFFYPLGCSQVSLGAVVVLLFFFFSAVSLGAVVVLLCFLVVCHWNSRGEMRAAGFCFYLLIAH